MTDFRLHPQLAKDTVFVKDLALCRLLLMKDGSYPWVILVPRRAGLREMHELDGADQQTLMAEITFVSRTIEAAFGADKMNVAALGNMVPQLHIHVITRFEGDAAWPGPVWGAAPPSAYSDEALLYTLEKIKEALK
jgi:diadenosine tetraphosphate (Ap4A) HIT family hydrolase